MKIGKLVGITYSQLKVKIASDIRGGSVNLYGSVYYFGNIGSYLKITNAIDETIICEVVSIFDSDLHQERASFDIESNRELLLKPVGTINKNKEFTLGVGVFPSLYSDVSIVTFDDMKHILRTHSESPETLENGQRIHQSFPLGVSKSMINYPIDVSIDSFFNIHSAVLGNSGSGKSNTIAHIIQEIHKKNEYSSIGSRLLIFDVNGEYKNAFYETKNSEISVKCFKPNINGTSDGYTPFYLPHFLMSLDEWSAFLLATDATQRPFWDKVLQESYRFYRIGSSGDEEKEKFVNYLRHRICTLIFSTLRQADSDTARITTAASILGSITSIINNNSALKAASADLLAEIGSLQQACTIAYGENKDKLNKATETVAQKVDEDKFQEVVNSKIKSGEFFDCKFLKIAAELVLLEEDARGNKQIRGYTATMMTRLDYFLDNPDCRFMRDAEKIKSREAFFEQLWGEESMQSQLVIIDTSELSPDILETLTSVLSRLLFDQRKKLVGDNRRKKPIHLILDEAHRYIKKHYDYLLKENIFEKIAREGRKYSFYLMVSSQRPSELSETVLSQCANFIIHRVQNEKDMHYIQAILPYFSDDFTNKIKQSIPGEALVFGNCVSMPLHLKIHKSNPTPNSSNCKITEEWFKEKQIGNTQ
ncbi:ATP-binding protein [Cysteiniphilum litorale]|uniref:ATP-binding protein n=2 Tax=Cysteiniphilum litorale TaxID=2056700 RepID=UPI003F8819D6